MGRTELQEIHDHPGFPAFLRDLVTDALQAIWNFGNSYKPILARLLANMERAGTRQVLDLCSGGGGPWLRLAREPKLMGMQGIVVRLTDIYPNRAAFEWASETSGTLTFEVAPVNATRIPPSLAGFRTIFSSFHHFAPQIARELLSDASVADYGVGIFETARRSPRTMLTICCLPFLVWWLTPLVRPFRWSRLLWTYLLPVVPFVLLYDGLVSCLRAYSREELRELVRPLARSGYCWEVGEERGGFLPITYLVGYPVRPSSLE
jgi:hypothetical protein